MQEATFPSEPFWNETAWRYKEYSQQERDAALETWKKCSEFDQFRQWYSRITPNLSRCTPAGTGLALYVKSDMSAETQSLEELGWRQDTKSIARSVGRRMYVHPEIPIQVLAAEGAFICNIAS